MTSCQVARRGAALVGRGGGIGYPVDRAARSALQRSRTDRRSRVCTDTRSGARTVVFRPPPPSPALPSARRSRRPRARDDSARRLTPRGRLVRAEAYRVGGASTRAAAARDDLAPRQKRGAGAGAGRASVPPVRACRTAWPHGPAGQRSKSTHALGILRPRRAHLPELEAGRDASLGSRLRHRSRAHAPRTARSFAGILAARGGGLPGLPRRASMAQDPRPLVAVR